MGRGKIVILTCESMLDPHIVGEMAKKRQIERKKDPKKLECGPDPKKSVHISHSSYNFMEKLV